MVTERRTVKEDILRIMEKGAYGYTGVLIAVSERRKERRNEMFDALVHGCLSELVAEGLVERGTFYEGRDDGRLGAHECYRKIVS